MTVGLWHADLRLMHKSGMLTLSLYMTNVHKAELPWNVVVWDVAKKGCLRTLLQPGNMVLIWCGETFRFSVDSG